MGFFDWFNPVNIVIMLLAGVNVYIYIRSLDAAKRLYGTLLPQEYAPKRYIPVSEKVGPRQIMMEIQLISQRREKAFKWYVYFSNITTVFPLLGIFGTVTSLIGTVNGAENLSGNFFAALTSTALGIVAAVVFKVLDCPVAAKLDECERLSEQVIGELNDMLRARSGEEDETFRPEETDMALYKERFTPKQKSMKLGNLLDKLTQKSLDSEESPADTDKPSENSPPAETDETKQSVVNGGSR